MQPEANKKHSRVNKKCKKKKKNHRLEGKYFYSCTFIAWGIIIPLLVSGGGEGVGGGGERTAMLFAKWIAPLTAFHSSGFSRVH